MNQYKLTYSQKNVTRVAPDAFILLNTKPTIEGADGSEVPVHEDVSNININGSIESPPSSASFTLVVTRAEESRYFDNGRCILQNMMEVKIFIKGRFYTLDDNGELAPPAPIQQFHGVITHITDSYNGDQHSITVECHDMLYWMKIIKMNMHPSVLTAQSVSNMMTPFRSIFEGTPAKDIVVKLANFAFGGDRKSKSGIINSLFTPETFNSVSFSMGIPNKLFDSRAEFVDMEKDAIQEFWARRFKLTQDQNGDTNFLHLYVYGYQEKVPPKNLVVNDPGLKNKRDSALNNTSQDSSDRPEYVVVENEHVNSIYRNSIADAVANATDGTFAGQQLAKVFDDVISKAAPFGQIATVAVVNSEYSSILDVITHVKEYIGYEFYMSLDGDIIFKPPFYNIDVKPYRPLVVKDSEVVSFSLSESDDVFTVFVCRGALSQLISTDHAIHNQGIAFDAYLARQYGIRVQTTDLQMAASKQEKDQANFLAIYAQNEMDRHNAKRRSGTLTMVGTPEIKLGYPIYFESRDCYCYVTGINHSFQFGSQFQTTVTFEAMRFKSPHGPNAVIAPDQDDTDDTTNVSNIAQIRKEIDDDEVKGRIKGSGTKINYTRAIRTKKDGDDGDSFTTTQIQQISDLDGYERIGVINYGADFLIDPTGAFQFKVKPLNFDTTSADDSTARLANNLASIDATANSPQSRTSVNDAGLPNAIPSDSGVVSDGIASINKSTG